MVSSHPCELTKAAAGSQSLCRKPGGTCAPRLSSHVSGRTRRVPVPSTQTPKRQTQHTTRCLDGLVNAGATFQWADCFVFGLVTLVFPEFPPFTSCLGLGLGFALVPLWERSAAIRTHSHLHETFQKMGSRLNDRKVGCLTVVTCGELDFSSCSQEWTLRTESAGAASPHAACASLKWPV